MLLDLLSVEYGQVVSTKDTHDLPRHLTKEYKKQLKKREEMLEAKRLEKVEEARKLREDIDRARGLLPDEEPAVLAEPILVPEEPKQDQIPSLLAQLDAVKHYLAALHQEQHLMAIEARRRRDEEDIQVILHVLSLH